MCSYNTLFRDPQIGYVVACTDCGHVQVGFGNVQLVLDIAAFDALRQEVGCVAGHTVTSDFPQHKNIVLRTACAGYNLLLSGIELKKFHAMLDMADSERLAIELIRLFREGQ